MQCACAIFSFVAWPPLQHFSTLSHKRQFHKNVIEHKILFRVSLQSLCEIFFILRRTERDMTYNVLWYSCKVHVILVRFWRNLNFLDGFSKKIHKYQIWWKSVQWEPNCSMRTDGTHIHDEVNSGF